MLAKTLHPFVRAANLDTITRRKKVIVHDFPNGVEVFIDSDVETCSDGSLFEEKQKTERGEGDLVRNRERAARRAKTQVRRRCKMIQADCMLTCTYRENMQDVERLQRDVKEFVRRIRALGPFEYVLAVEPQKRGALHVHMACQAFPAWMRNADGVRVKSFDLIRSIWRSVVGRDNGTVNQSKPRRNGCHRIASYISKYIAKGIEDAVFNAKSYWSSRGIPEPKKTVLWFSGEDSTMDIVSLVVKDFLDRGYTDIAQYASAFHSFNWFAASSPSA